MALVALLSLTWQSLVVQTHVHLPVEIAGLAVDQPGHAVTTLSSDERPTDPPLDCPICRQIGQAGAYLTPTPIAFHAPLAVIAWMTVAPLSSWSGRQRSHAWRSRAPPTRVQNSRP